MSHWARVTGFQQYTELAWRSGCVMDCRATARGSIPGGYGVKTELHIFRKGQYIGVPSLNDLAIDGALNTTNQPTSQQYRVQRVID